VVAAQPQGSATAGRRDAKRNEVADPAPLIFQLFIRPDHNSNID